MNLFRDSAESHTHMPKQSYMDPNSVTLEEEKQIETQDDNDIEMHFVDSYDRRKETMLTTDPTQELLDNAAKSQIKKIKKILK